MDEEPGAEPLKAGALEARLRRLEERVAALEARPPARAAAALQAAASAEDEAPRLPALPQGGLALAGRTLLVLAGAYLVRALADAGALPLPLAAALGLAYAVSWQLAAEREARAGRRASAGLHGLSGCAIGFPLIWEATARFGLLDTSGAFAALLAFAALGLAVAWRHRLAANAWLAGLGACLTAGALAASTRAPLAAMASLLALAALVEWLGRRDDWPGLRWGLAAALDAFGLLLVAVAARAEPPAGYAPVPTGAAVALLLALPLLYAARVAARTFLREGSVGPFDLVQGPLAAALGFVGARNVLVARGATALVPALVAAALGALAYAAAFAHAERRPGRGRNFYFYSTAGGLLLLAFGLGLGLGDRLAPAWAALGLAAVVLGRRFDRTTLRAHGALYLGAAAVASGLAPAGGRALVGLPVPALGPSAWLSGLGAAIAWAVLAGEGDAGPSGRRWPRLIVALLVAAAATAAVHRGLAAAFGSRLAGDATALSVVRAAVLAAFVLGLAWLARHGMPELVWLVRPLLVAGGVLLLLDLRGGRPATLVASLGLYGLLLTLVPRLLSPRARAG